MNDKIFGELIYHYGWNGKLSVVLANKTYIINVHIVTNENRKIEKFQYRAYENYLKDAESIWNDALLRIFSFYQEEFQEYREMYEEDADIYAPHIDSIEELLCLINPIGLVFPQENSKTDFGILFECSWDMDAGVGIRVKKNEVVEVGTQHIVL